MRTLEAPAQVDLAAPVPGATRVKVRFLSPVELKKDAAVAHTPEFGLLFARLRDRVSTLRALYGEGPLAIDFKATGERARHVKLERCELRWEAAARRSGRTGQVHGLGGFVGEAEYAGDLAEFIPYLELARWVGVGRQTVWGKGELEVAKA
jgi:CRISPR/Cas system endoribonuclease Cas6 (RAMP superfamily)